MRGISIFLVFIALSVSHSQQSLRADSMLPPIYIRLISNADGSLAQLILGRKKMGNDANVFERLQGEILKMIGRPGNPLTYDMDVEITADKKLNCEFLMKTISACSGKTDPKTGRFIRYIHYFNLKLGDGKTVPISLVMKK